VPAGADLVTYWVSKAWQQIKIKQTKRGGLVTTNSIRGGQNRKVLDTVCTDGRIFAAWSDEPWVLDGANVRVSIVCFDAGDTAITEVQLDSKPVIEIYPDLTGRQDSGRALDLTLAKPIDENKNVIFMGTTKVGPFDVPGELARNWLSLPSNPNGRRNSDVVRPWANAMDIVRRSSDTWIVDFGVEMNAADAACYEEPFEYVRKHVKPIREKNRRGTYAKYWWRFGEARPALRASALPLSRFIATPSVSKHRLFVFLHKAILPDHAVFVITRDDDTTFGILHSRFHELWSLRMGTSLEDRPRYTPSSTFETFPFPTGLTPEIPAKDYSTDSRAEAIAKAARHLVTLRENWLNPPELVKRVPEVVPNLPDRILPVNENAAVQLKKRTLTNLYNQRPTWLRKAHESLDQAVASAYGWSNDIADEEVLGRLLQLNLTRSSARTLTDVIPRKEPMREEEIAAPGTRTATIPEPRPPKKEPAREQRETAKSKRRINQ